MLLGTVFFNSKMAKFIFKKEKRKSLCGGSHRVDKFDLKQAVDRNSTGLPDPSVAAPAASPSGSAAPSGGPVGGLQCRLRKRAFAETRVVAHSRLLQQQWRRREA
jgi:hypothetical protein